LAVVIFLAQLGQFKVPRRMGKHRPWHVGGRMALERAALYHAGAGGADRGTERAPAGAAAAVRTLAAPLCARLGSGGDQGDLLIDSPRQQQLLERATVALKEAGGAVEAGVALDFVAADLKDALDALGEITGEVTSADILNQIFGDFCVGK